LGGFKISNILKIGIVTVPVIILLLLAFTPCAYAETSSNPKLTRMLELKVFSNSTAIAKVSSTSLVWSFFKKYYYELNESYWHYYAVDRIVKMFRLSDYHILRMGEETQGGFAVELTFQFNDCGTYEKDSGRLRIVDSFKENGEYLSLIKIKSEINIYDCSPRDRIWPFTWLYTREIEWYNTGLYEAPDEYYLFFKIPIRVITNLPPDSVWRLYVDSKPVEIFGNSSTIYVEGGSIISVERILEYGNDIWYVCYSPSVYISYASITLNRTLSFRYIKEYMVYFDSRIEIKAIVFNGLEYAVPFKTWVAENTSVNVSVIPAYVQGSFINHVFDGWIDDNGEMLGKSFIVTKPMRLSPFWRRELNYTNITIVIVVLIVGFLIPEVRKRVSIEIVRRNEAEDKTGQDDT